MQAVADGLGDIAAIGEIGKDLDATEKEEAQPMAVAVVSSQIASVAAAAVALHGLAGRLAARGGRPVTAPDIINALPDAIALVRRGGEA